MIKTFFAVAWLAIVFTSCDVRDKDKKEIGSLIEKPLEAAVTTVQIIDSSHNFGQVTEGEIVEFNFRFKNSGTAPLVITNVSASCGCTVPEKPEQPIKPGETGFIKAKFNTDKRPGESSKSVTVSSNAQPPFPELILRGKILPKNAISN
jgi:hypothetical protein